METKNCENCGYECYRDEVDIGVGVIYGPWGCSCGWSEWDEYNQLLGNGGIQEDGAYIDPQGGVYPKDNPIAIATRGFK